jgi:hypothetical protein
MPSCHTGFAPYDWWYARERIGQKLRERYVVPKDLPPQLLSLVRKLDAIEGKRLSNRMQQARLEAEWPKKVRA